VKPVSGRALNPRGSLANRAAFKIHKFAPERDWHLTLMGGVLVDFAAPRLRQAPTELDGR